MVYIKLCLKTKTNPVGQVVDINGYNYKVIGVLKEEGQNKNSNNDKTAFIPLLNGKDTTIMRDCPIM